MTRRRWGYVALVVLLLSSPFILGQVSNIGIRFTNVGQTCAQLFTTPIAGASFCYYRDGNILQYWNGTTWNPEVQLGSYTVATLPACTAASTGRVYYLTNGIKGPWICTGTANVLFQGFIETKWFTGLADLGAQIQAAHDLSGTLRCLTATGCTIETGDFVTTQTISAITITKPVHIKLGCGAYNLSASMTFSDTSPMFSGTSEGCTKITWTGNATTPAIDCQACGYGTILEKFQLTSSAATPMLSGIRFGNYKYNQATTSSLQVVRDVTINGVNGGLLRGGVVWDPFVQPITNTVSGSLNNTTSPISIAVTTCANWPPSGAFVVFIDDSSNYETAVAGSGGCSGTTLTLTRSAPFTHAGTVTLYQTMDSNNDATLVERVKTYYPAAGASGALIEGSQATIMRFKDSTFEGNQQVVYGVRSGSLRIAGGNFSVDGFGGNENEIDYYLYNTAGAFMIENCNSENSKAMLVTSNAQVVAPTTIKNCRSATVTGRLAANLRRVDFGLGGPLTLIGNNFYYDNAATNVELRCGPSAGDACMAYGNTIVSGLTQPFTGAIDGWDQAGNTRWDAAGVYVARIPPTSYQHAVGTTGTLTSNLVWNATATVADGGTITHGMGATPTACIVSTSVSGEGGAVTSIGATTFAVPIKKLTDGSAGTTQTIYWMCWK